MQYLSSSLEDYLEIIYILMQNSDSVGITDIAKALSISKPSVNKAVNLLKEKGYICQEKYGKIIFTDKGINTAKSVYKKHNMLTVFLKDVLGVSKKTAEIDACKVQHVLSNETILRMEYFLKNKKGE